MRGMVRVTVVVGLVALSGWVQAGLAAEVGPARPSNPGKPGPAASMIGDAEDGGRVFQLCVACHGPEGRGGVRNPGSDEKTVPELTPLDPSLIDPDPATFAANLDLFLQHGSAQSGRPLLSMPAWGTSRALSQQQIADVEAYIMRLNGASR